MCFGECLKPCERGRHNEKPPPGEGAGDEAARGVWLPVGGVRDLGDGGAVRFAEERDDGLLLGAFAATAPTCGRRGALGDCACVGGTCATWGLQCGFAGLPFGLVGGGAAGLLRHGTL